MRLYIDANILVSVLNKEYPLFPFTSRILTFAGVPGFRVFTSPLCLAIAFYFTEKKSNRKTAKKKINLLTEHLIITGNSPTAVKESLMNPEIHDFEDGLEYYAAMENGCDFIITENVKDFYFSKIEVMNSRDFLRSVADSRKMKSR